MPRPADVQLVSIEALQSQPQRYMPAQWFLENWWAAGYWGIAGKGAYIERFNVDVDLIFEPIIHQE